MSYANQPALFYEHPFTEVSYPDPNDLGKTGTIVMILLTDFNGKGYTVYVDNYCNFARLTQQLSSNKTYICGALLQIVKAILRK